MNTLELPSVIAHSAFSLTDMQQAYWLGEQDIYRLQTPAMLYRGFFARQLNVPLLQQALLELTHRHPTLFTRVLADGTQKTAAPPNKIEVTVTDLHHLTATEATAFLASRKEQLEDGCPRIGDGPHFSCWVDRAEEGVYLHFVLRLIAFDGRSIMIFFNELAALYAGLPITPPPALSFKDFVQRQQAVKAEPGYQQSLAYWRARTSELPSAPEMPTVHPEKIPQRSRFSRFRLKLDPAAGTQLHQQARKCGVTINALLCTLYVDVLRLWSRHEAFTLNLLMSQRPGEPDYAGIVGNFSSTLLLEVQANGGSFQERAKAIQRQLYRDIAHTSVSGVEVIRAMGHNSHTSPAMPIVFASTLGLEMAKDTITPATIGWSVTDDGLRTPQVWLDHQAYMDGELLMLNMDFAEGVFLPQVPEDFFTVYQAHLETIQQTQFPCDDPLLPQIPQNFLSARQKANATSRLLPGGLLQDFFAEAAATHGDLPALIGAQRSLSYSELWRYTTQLAQQLRHSGVVPNSLVTVMARRGWRQVAALMAVVQSGGAYLPVAHDLPATRKTYLLSQVGVKVLLAERDLIGDFEVPAGVLVLALEDVLPEIPPAQAVAITPAQTPEDLAYVIFTSGSTGQPKGVAINHRGAVNTIQDIIGRFGLSPDDRVMGLSAFNFDLSVFDIFGTLGVGAALLLPPPSDTPAPDQWVAMARDHHITLWNTVPALLEMAIEYMGATAAEHFAHLRLAMLSGDWIPVSLPGRLAAIAPEAQFVALGGATEASIWSNYFMVKGELDPTWDNVPYGWPLSNQSFHVLNRHLQPVPDWVAGDLYIGGIGLAQGYYNDPERTASSFIFHPVTGERLYKTGDVGRYYPAGWLEFLGRSDNQVKIRGFRIELGEIDTALERCPGVRHGAAIVRTIGERDRQLVAFYVRRGDETNEALIRQQLTACLPEYMVPALLVEIEQMFFTANGKVDRKSLQQSAAELAVDQQQKTLPRNPTEAALVDLWDTLLGSGKPCIHANFFDLGGSSLLAVRLLNAISQNFKRELPLASLLRHNSIAAQAELLKEECNETPLTRDPVVMIREGQEGAFIMVHPVGGNILCYRDIAAFIPDDMALIGLQSPGNGAARTVTSLAESYLASLQQQLPPGIPLYLFGWSMGGVVAQEMARLLETSGRTVAGLTLVDSWMGHRHSQPSDRLEGLAHLESFVTDFLDGAPLSLDVQAIANHEPNTQIEMAIELLRQSHSVIGDMPPAAFTSLLREHEANFNALIQHRPQKIRTPTQQFRASLTRDFAFLEPFDLSDQCRQWEGLSTATHLEEDHYSIIKSPDVRRMVEATLDTLTTEASSADYSPRQDANTYHVSEI